MIADVTNHIYTHDMNERTSESQPASAPTTYVIFRAYSITSAYLSNGVCTTISGGAITLPTPYSILKPATPYDQESFRNSARLLFQSYAGFTGCSAGAAGATPTGYVQVVHTTGATGALPRMSVSGMGPATSIVAVHTSTPIASINWTSQQRQSASAASSRAPSTNLGGGLSHLTNSSPGFPTRVKIVVGVVVPLGVVALLLFGGVLYYTHRACRRKSCLYDDVCSEKNSSPYFQQKPELHGDQCRHEMPAEHKRHEVEAEEMRHQLPADDQRLELEACHCGHELEAPTSSKPPRALDAFPSATPIGL
ncbi:hypothetical protein MMC22_007905 [Lobaria immixta]|nr:hypothetical protein [Lobaria immixta]